MERAGAYKEAQALKECGDYRPPSDIGMYVGLYIFYIWWFTVSASWFRVVLGFRFRFLVQTLRHAPKATTKGCSPHVSPWTLFGRVSACEKEYLQAYGI